MNAIKMKDMFNNDVVLNINDIFKAIMLDGNHDDISRRFYNKELDLCIRETLDRLYNIRCNAANLEYEFGCKQADKLLSINSKKG